MRREGDSVFCSYSGALPALSRFFLCQTNQMFDTVQRCGNQSEARCNVLHGGGRDGGQGDDRDTVTGKVFREKEFCTGRLRCLMGFRFKSNDFSPRDFIC